MRKFRKAAALISVAALSATSILGTSVSALADDDTGVVIVEEADASKTDTEKAKEPNTDGAAKETIDSSDTGSEEIIEAEIEAEITAGATEEIISDIDIEKELGGEPQSFAITVKESENGILEVIRSDKTKAKEALAGEELLIKVTPDKDYALEDLNIEAESSVEVSENKDGYAFKMPESDITVSASFKKAATRTKYVFDAKTEDYLRANADPSFMKADKMELVNAMNINNTFVDVAKTPSGATIDSVMDSPKMGEMFVGQVSNLVPVYNLDDNSSYYAAYIDMYRNYGGRLYDADFAIYNNLGQTIDAVFDSSTGIAYIPKAAFVENGAVVGGRVQAQVMYGFEYNVAAALSTSNMAETRTRSTSGSQVSLMADPVPVPGAPDANAEMDTSKPGADPSNAADMVPVAKALSLPADAAPGKSYNVQIKMQYIDMGDAASSSYNYSIAGTWGTLAEYDQALLDLVMNGGNVDYSLLRNAYYYRQSVVNLEGSNGAMGGFTFQNTIPYFTMKCIHISSGIPAERYPVLVWDYANAVIRILELTDTYAVLGIATQVLDPGVSEQGGLGIVKVLVDKPKGHIELNKAYQNPSLAVNSSCYSLEGAQYGIYKDADCTQLVETITTDATGFAKSSGLDNGNYWVKETAPSKGCDLDRTVYPAAVDNAGPIPVVKSVEPMTVDPLEIKVNKKDASTGEKIPVDGAEFTITHYAGQYTKDEVNAGKPAQDGVETRSWTFKTVDGMIRIGVDTEKYFVSGDEFYKRLDGEKTLPHGTVTVKETKAPEGFEAEDLVIMNSAGVTLDTSDDYFLYFLDGEHHVEYTFGEMTVLDKQTAGNVRIEKADEEGQPMEGVEFKITSLENGKTMTVETDENGIYDSSSDRESWMGDGKRAGADGVFPYGKYTIEELSCEANEGMTLIPVKTFEVTENEETITFSLTNVEPLIGTQAMAKETGSQQGVCGDITVIDTISYKGLYPETQYTAETSFIDAATGQILKDADGNEIKAVTAFTTGKAESEEDYTVSGTAEIGFTFNAKDFDGTTAVIYEAVKLDGEIVATHEKIDAEEQMIYFPKLKTTAENKETGEKLVSPSEKVTVKDVVEYTNLIPGKEYTVKGVLMCKETNAPLICNDKEVTSEITFEAEKADGTIEMEFTFDASALKGQSLVVFEDLYQDEVHVCAHNDLTDEDQTVYVPEIGTTAKDAEDGDHEIVTDGTKNVKLIDTVEFDKLVPGKTYVLKGVLMDKSTGKAFLVDNKEVTSEVRFVPETASGSVDVEFEFNAKAMLGKETVVFEKLFIVKSEVDDKGKTVEKLYEIAKHEDITDAGQTVKFTTPPKTPNTGDNTAAQPFVFIILGAGAAAAVSLAVIFRRKRS